MNNEFELKQAFREDVSLNLGIVGATGAGKTGSALEVATGWQDVQGGDIAILETDGKRSLAYADAPMFSDPKRTFKFKRAPLATSFSPLRYKAGVESLVAQGAKHIIIDSASHMHEGPGGTLDAHAKEVERIAAAWGIKPDKANFPAWVRPKAELTQFIQYFKSLQVNLIFCFRAKEKLRLIGGKPVDAGWQPIANEELFFEMDLACLLLPNSDGQPIWNHDEHKPLKALPAHFRPMFQGNPRLSIELGRKMALWAKGGEAKAEAPKAQASTPTAQPAPQAPAKPSAPTIHPFGEEASVKIAPGAILSKPAESHTQRAVKLMATLNGATSTTDLKDKARAMKDEPKEVTDIVADTYAAKLQELKEAGL